MRQFKPKLRQESYEALILAGGAAPSAQRSDFRERPGQPVHASCKLSLKRLSSWPSNLKQRRAPWQAVGAAGGRAKGKGSSICLQHYGIKSKGFGVWGLGFRNPKSLLKRHRSFGGRFQSFSPNARHAVWALPPHPDAF